MHSVSSTLNPLLCVRRGRKGGVHFRCVVGMKSSEKAAYSDGPEVCEATGLHDAFLSSRQIASRPFQGTLGGDPEDCAGAIVIFSSFVSDLEFLSVTVTLTLFPSTCSVGIPLKMPFSSN